MTVIHCVIIKCIFVIMSSYLYFSSALCSVYCLLTLPHIVEVSTVVTSSPDIEADKISLGNII